VQTVYEKGLVTENSIEKTKTILKTPMAKQGFKENEDVRYFPCLTNQQDRLNW
jgi:hypothetical protein